MRKRLIPIVVAFSVGLGLIFSGFDGGPAHHLLRPIVALGLLSLVVGLFTSWFGGRASGLVAAFCIVWILRPMSTPAIVVSVLVAVVVGWKLWRDQVPRIENPTLAAAIAFLLSGGVLVAGSITWDAPLALAGENRTDRSPTFLILLDGYPREDTLMELGVDISGFVDGLEKRGFDHYPTAVSHHTWTWRTLTYMLTGQPMESDEGGEPEDQRAARLSWRLPPEFVVVDSAFGVLNIPGAPMLNPGGPTGFEYDLLRRSIIGRWADDYVMDGLRFQLERSLDLLMSTDRPRVFAHLLAPHVPFLFDGDGNRLPLDSDCWPDCSPLDITPHRTGTTEEDWSEGIDGYLSWLNPRLLSVADSLIAKHPDAAIVLFSDHGGRFNLDDRDEWHRVFMAARTPGSPTFFEDDPRPSRVLELVPHP